tara:strand:- start:24 stop:740 length:717 start_codon:yes stop_codon:yes gene_type:complete
MYYSSAKLFLNICDSFNKRKIVNFLKQNNGNKMSVLVDVGAHYGESIKIFNKHFEINTTLSFEPSKKNFQILKEKVKNFKKVKIFNIAIGEISGEVDFKQHFDSESSTVVRINENSNYFKKKKKYLNFFSKNKKNYSVIKVKIDRLDNILKNLKLSRIDILKIDTEGYDFSVIKGLGEMIKNVKFIYFEHHFHNMLEKKYTFYDVDTFMKKNNFKKVFKTKMFFRKTFEYIYKNNLEL